MVDSTQPRPQQYLGEDRFHGISSPVLPVAGTSWSAVTFMAPMPPQHPQSAPSSDRRPLPGQPCGQAGVLRDDMLPSTNVAGNRQVDGDPAARDRLQDLGYSDMACDHSTPYGHHDHIILDHARVAQDVPTQAHVTPPAPVIDIFNDVQQAAASPTPAILDEVSHQDAAPNGRASEVLRQLALLYLNDPNSQLVMIRMGPGHADEVTVDFTLKLTNL